MADYWKSQARKYCDFCKCWIADNKPSIDFHEGGKKHKENVSKRLKEIHKNSAKQVKQQKKFENDLQQMEKAAMAAYLKDVESNTRDMTADKIIHEKWNKTEESKVDKSSHQYYVPDAAPEAHPRFNESSYSRSYGIADIDPLDPFAKQKIARLEARQAKATKQAAKSDKDNQEKGKSENKKDKSKKCHEQPSGSRLPVRKVWYEARSQGYSYYWNVETNESVWEPPAEGFMSLAEQAEEAKEKVLQEQLLQQIDKEQAKEKAELLEEQRANAEREKLKEIRKRYLENKKVKSGGEVEEDFEEEKIPYRRDYSVPEKPQPYGSWQIIKTIDKPQIDLQLPQVNASAVPAISFEELPPQKVFKEKIISHVNTGDSDDEGSTVSFKRRKFGNKNVRKRMEDD